MQTAELLIRKRYYEYVLFLIPVFIVQVTELVQFKINVRKFHRFTCFRQWRSRAGGKDNTGRPSQTTIQSKVSISETVRNRTHVHIKFLLRMTDTMTSQNIDLTSWDTLYMCVCVCVTGNEEKNSLKIGRLWVENRTWTATTITLSVTANMDN